MTSVGDTPQGPSILIEAIDLQAALQNRVKVFPARLCNEAADSRATIVQGQIRNAAALSSHADLCQNIDGAGDQQHACPRLMNAHKESRTRASTPVYTGWSVTHKLEEGQRREG